MEEDKQTQTKPNQTACSLEHVFHTLHLSVALWVAFCMLWPFSAQMNCGPMSHMGAFHSHSDTQGCRQIWDLDGRFIRERTRVAEQWQARDPWKKTTWIIRQIQRKTIDPLNTTASLNKPSHMIWPKLEITTVWCVCTTLCECAFTHPGILKTSLLMGVFVCFNYQKKSMKSSLFWIDLHCSLMALNSSPGQRFLSFSNVTATVWTYELWSNRKVGDEVLLNHTNPSVGANALCKTQRKQSCEHKQNV